MSSTIREFRRTPLAVSIATLFAISANVAIATVRPVTNCDDTSPTTSGSLRQVIASASDGDTIDMSGLPALGCSTITVHEGEIKIAQQSLILKGSTGDSADESHVTLNGKYSADLDRSRIINHAGYGQLTLDGLIVRGGSIYSTTHGEYGGCVRSKGSVVAHRSTFEYCQANAKGFPTAGGAIFASGNVLLEYSIVKDNNAGAQTSTAAYGGGVHAGNVFYSINSTIAQNTAGSAGFGAGGGVYAQKNAGVVRSTISGNRANTNGGAMYVKQASAGSQLTLSYSTISGNTATNGFAGGIYTNESFVAYFSTVAFNTAAQGQRNFNHYDAAGVDMGTSIAAVTATLRNSLFANNTYATIRSDISIYDSPGKTVSVVGSGNLIVGATFVMPPGVVASSSCPLLGPLRDNGGTTLTHALSSHSPAIDTGDNPDSFVTYDQRNAPYFRQDHGTVDIGAYEVQQEEIIFNAGFDGC